MPTRADHILPLVREPRVLDMGCADHAPGPDSPYWLHGQFRRRFPGAAGIDINAENVDKLRALGYKGISQGDAETFVLPGRFDTIVACERIEHLANPGSFLLRCGNIWHPRARKGGAIKPLSILSPVHFVWNF